MQRTAEARALCAACSAFVASCSAFFLLLPWLHYSQNSSWLTQTSIQFVVSVLVLD